MIVDSSAVVAVVLRERGFEDVWAKLLRAGGAGVGTPTLVESGIVLRSRLGPPGRTLLEAAIDSLRLVPIAFVEHHWSVALDAFSYYGRGNHPARLNLGDCMAYAVAKVAREPLLCLGDDFAKTDLVIA